MFEKKIAIYFQTLIGQPREKISFNYSTKNAVNIVLQASQIDIASCLVDYLEDKYIILKKNTIQNINIGRIEEVPVRYVLGTLLNYGIN